MALLIPKQKVVLPTMKGLKIVCHQFWKYSFTSAEAEKTLTDKINPIVKQRKKIAIASELQPN